MARKKHRPPQPAQGNETAVLAGPPSPTIPAPPPKAAATPPAQSGGTFRDTPLGRNLVALFYAFASLQLAVCLLSLFTLCLIAATLLESWYSTKIAQDMVYRTWWFALLLALLSVNVLCAALKKYPWKKYQTGFLITHSGLLMLMAGGLLTALAGVEGLVAMVDTEKPGIQQQVGLPNRSSTLLFPDEQKIEYWRARKGAVTGERDAELIGRLIGRDWNFRVFQDRDDFDTLLRWVSAGLKKLKGVDFDPKDMAALKQLIGNQQEMRAVLKAAVLEDDGKQQLAFSPGPFTWYDDEFIKRKLPLSLEFFSALASPVPGFSRDLDGRARLTVDNFYSHTEYAEYSKAPQGVTGFPALKLHFRSPNFGKTQPQWVGAIRGGEYRLQGAAQVEFLILRDAALLPEFLDPPPPEKMGKEGQLVLVLGGRTFRVPVNKDNLAKAVPLEGTDRQVTLKKYTNNFLEPEQDAAEYPAVEFELTGPEGKTDYIALARLPHLSQPRGLKGERAAVWYHHPDYRWGNSHLNGNLQFLQAPDGGLYYRVYGKDGLRGKGQVDLDKLDDPDQYYTAWRVPMDLSFQVTEYLPQATDQPRNVPRNVRPGLDRNERSDLEPAIRCTLSQGQHNKSFWVRMSATAPEKVQVGDAWYFFRYGMASQPLPFELTLKKAERQVDPGTIRDASFSSLVELHAQERGGQTIEREQLIYMNNPLEFASYKVYQSGFDYLGPDPADDRPVNKSVLQVAYDPGLWPKYIGSLVVVLGIVVMFYMKAYFFKPRGRQQAVEPEPSVVT
jgi:hypothetical protein